MRRSGISERHPSGTRPLRRRAPWICALHSGGRRRGAAHQRPVFFWFEYEQKWRRCMSWRPAVRLKKGTIPTPCLRASLLATWRRRERSLSTACRGGAAAGGEADAQAGMVMVC